MRRDFLSLSASAEAEGTDVNTIRRYVGTALKQDRPGGRYRATVYDRIARTLNFLTPQGMVAVEVRGSRTASRIGEYMNAVRTYSTSGDTSAVARFNGKSFRANGVTYDFITDVSILDRLIDAGVLAIEGLYRVVQGG